MRYVTLKMLLCVISAVLLSWVDAISTSGPINSTLGSTAGPLASRANSLIPQRVRKSWSAFTQAEKDLYLRAVRKAMEAGYQHRFAEIHAELENRVRCHGTCGFLLWHRRFVLGYENMLRSVGPEYANVTLPYWNYFEDSARQLSSTDSCASFEACSKFLQDMGGGGTSDNRIGQSQVVAGTVIDYGSCVSTGIARFACANSVGLASGKCEGCIMRGHWSNQSKIMDMMGSDILTLLNVFQARSSDPHRLLSSTIESRFHNALHNTLSGTMSFMASPFDPVFFGHHATVDMALFIFNRCRYDAKGVLDMNSLPRPSTFDVFKSCDVADNAQKIDNLRPANDMTMNLNNISVDKNPNTSSFFTNMGTKFNDFVNVEDLGEHSYTYYIDSYMKTFLESHQIRCPSYIFESPLTPTTPVSTPLSTLPWTGSGSHSRAGFESATAGSGGYFESARVPRFTWRPRTPQPSGLGDDKAAKAATDVSMALAACGDEIMRMYPSLTFSQRLEQEAILKCLVIRAKNNGTLIDYSPIFRQQFMIPTQQKPYCVELLGNVDSRLVTVLASESCLTKYGNLTGVQFIKH